MCEFGYFAFDPNEYDTYVDGEQASFSPGWAKVGWATPLVFFPVFRFDTATPYIDFKTGVHSFAFVPAGQDLGAAILGPQEVTFEAGHRYSLAIIGEIENGTLSLLTIDETEAFQGSDLENSYLAIVIHDTPGAPPIDVIMGSDKDVVVDNLEYGQWATFMGTEEFPYWEVFTAEDPPVKLFELDPSAVQHRISDLAALSGSYPGEVGKDIFWDYNWAWAGDVTIAAGGEVAVGDAIAGKIDAPTHRVAYTLRLDLSTVLDIFAIGTGPRTADLIDTGLFDPMLFIYDEHGNLLFWNDEGPGLSQHKGGAASDAALTTVSLNAGVYTIQVAGYADLGAGPYALIVRRPGHLSLPRCAWP